MDSYQKFTEPVIGEEDIHSAIINSEFTGISVYAHNILGNKKIYLIPGFDNLIGNFSDIVGDSYSQINLGNDLRIAYSPKKEHFALGFKSGSNLEIKLESDNISKSMAASILRTINENGSNLKDDEIIREIGEIFDELEVEYDNYMSKSIPITQFFAEIKPDELLLLIPEKKIPIDLLMKSETIITESEENNNTILTNLQFIQNFNDGREELQEPYKQKFSEEVLPELTVEAMNKYFGRTGIPITIKFK